MAGGSVLWFRHGLRLHDNPALISLVSDCRGPFFPIFIFDGESAGTKLVGYNRMRYLLEALNDLDNQFRQAGGRLFMIRGNQRILSGDIGKNVDCEPVWAERDNQVKALCRDVGIVCREYVSHTLWDPSMVIRANGGIPPLTYQMFLHTVSTIGDPPRPEPNVKLNKIKFGTLPACFYEEFQIFDKAPSPEDLGVQLEQEDVRMIRWMGGETAALQQMENRLCVERDAFTNGSFLPTHSDPDLLSPPVSLSPALRFGCLSVRKFYWKIHDLFFEVHGHNLPSAPTLQLIWREYFYTMSVNNPNYGNMANNPICLDIPWKVADSTELQRWTSGMTGFPFIDAAMRQLRSEGWLHHAVRNATASFLTRGVLWTSWEPGLQHFLKYLLDADWSVCAGNWMWVSSSAFEALLDSSACACPVRLGQRLDPRGQYVRRYVPEMQNMPVQYIYEPWKAPIDVQENADCIIGKDYPTRMVNHEQASARNSRAMMELRQRLEKAPPHCSPSSEEEIRQFMWLKDNVQMHEAAVRA